MLYKVTIEYGGIRLTKTYYAETEIAQTAINIVCDKLAVEGSDGDWIRSMTCSEIYLDKVLREKPLPAGTE